VGCACSRFRDERADSGRGDFETLRAAQKICAGCVVREPCLEFALATKALGIWGGKTEQQRQRMLGQRGGPVSVPGG
jgi:hypothetical protein